MVTVYLSIIRVCVQLSVFLDFFVFAHIYI